MGDVMRVCSTCACNVYTAERVLIVSFNYCSVRRFQADCGFVLLHYSRAMYY